MNLDLFGSEAEVGPRRIDLLRADLVLHAGLFSRSEADDLLRRLQAGIPWRQERITLYGRTHDVPRLTAWHGDADRVYTYSGIRVETSPWTPELLDIRRRVEVACGERFNSVLLNRYRDGADGVAWHNDDEPELGDEPVIASVSLGEERPFQFKAKFDPSLRHTVVLEHGSLLVMRGPTQANWLHQVPKSTRPMGERLNLTFRTVR